MDRDLINAHHVVKIEFFMMEFVLAIPDTYKTVIIPNAFQKVKLQQVLRNKLKEQPKICLLLGRLPVSELVFHFLVHFQVSNRANK